MKYAFSSVLVVATAMPLLCVAESAKEQYLKIGEICAKAHEARLCMESYGFFCNEGRQPHRSIEAQHLGCNLDLGDGRYHFVQMLYDHGGWNVEVENTYVADYEEPRWPQEDSSLALSSYIEQRMDNYRMHSSGGGTNAWGQPTDFFAGARRLDTRIAVGAACGTTVDVEYDKDVETALMAECERLLLRTVKRLSQSKPSDTYRVSAPSNFDWDKQVVTLVSGDNALIIEGRYEFANAHTPCLWVSDCCSTEGSFYLNSCRTPSEGDLQVIQTCLSEAGSPRSHEFEGCLRSAGVKTGCEVQQDGSQVCF